MVSVGGFNTAALECHIKSSNSWDGCNHLHICVARGVSFTLCFVDARVTTFIINIFQLRDELICKSCIVSTSICPCKHN